MIGARIRQARITAGMTQDEFVLLLATEGISLTKGGLSKYERGGSVPKATVIDALARAAGLDASYFLEAATSHVTWLAFRKSTRMGTKRERHVKALAESQVDACLALQSALGPVPATDLPPRIRIRELADAESAAESLRTFWRLGEHAIESVCTAIEDGGGIVVEVPNKDDLFHGLSGWASRTIPVVVVGAGTTADRRRVRLAQELGRLLMDVGDIEPAAQKKFELRFVAAFLVTATSARYELGVRRRRLDFRELAMLKRKYGLSMRAWIDRANDLEIIDPAHARSLLAEMSARGWRRQEPVAADGSERPRKLRQLTVRALAEGLLNRAQAERICPGVSRDVDELDEAPKEALLAQSLMRLLKSDHHRMVEQADALAADGDVGGR
jgi:transcriptional regulator with XRE-family HTH domain